MLTLTVHQLRTFKRQLKHFCLGLTNYCTSWLFAYLLLTNTLTYLLTQPARGKCSVPQVNASAALKDPTVRALCTEQVPDTITTACNNRS